MSRVFPEEKLAHKSVHLDIYLVTASHQYFGLGRAAMMPAKSMATM